MTTFLAVDIGGTKSELAIYDFAAKSYVPLIKQRYVNADFSSFTDVLVTFLATVATVATVPVYASIGLAGIVSGDTAQLTNIPWRIDSSELIKQFGFKTVLLANDLTALCNALPLLLPDDLLEIRPGKAFSGEVKAVIAPGTGLGQGFLLENDGRFFAQGSEGGHVDFGPVDAEQLALLAWMQKKNAHVSYEMLIAGCGIPNLYDFCREYYDMAESAEISQQMKGQIDRTPVIGDGAIADLPCPLCKKTIDLFLAILGSEAGNLALKLYARGGIYIGGGIVPRLAGKVSFAGFRDNFLRKGQMAGLVKDIPVQLIMKKDAALLGAARMGRHMQRT